MSVSIFFFQAEDGIRGLVRSRGVGDVYKRQVVRLPRRSGRQGFEPVMMEMAAKQPTAVVSGRLAGLPTGDESTVRAE